MNEIQDTLLFSLPSKRKQTPSGWLAVDAPCCHNRGESRDTRQRGGVILTPDGGFTWHCFNCGFKAGWKPGKLLSSNTKLLFKWLNLSDNDIGKLGLLALKIRDAQPINNKKLAPLNLELAEKELPNDAKPINEYIQEGNITPELEAVINYIVHERGLGWDCYNWHWTPEPGYADRVIIPFYNNGKIVGYTGRKITNGKPKYLTDAQPGYVFNIDAQNYSRKYVIVVEGQFDAIAVDGVAIMHNEPNETQCLRINNLGKEVIVVPDRDKAGAKLLKAAIEHNWHVSLPPWGNNIKDVADAVKEYGRLYVLATILHYRVHGEIKINLIKKQLENIVE